MDRFNALYIRLRSNQFAQDSFWALLGNVVAKGMSLLGAILVARFLGKEVFGEFGTIKSTLMNLAIFSTFGLGYTATKYIAENKEGRPEILRALARRAMQITAVVSGLMALLLLMFSGYVAETVLKASHLITPLRMVALWLVFNALTTTQVGILSGFGAFKAMARINAWVGVLAFSTSVIFTYFWMLEGALLALLITQGVNWILNYLEVTKVLPEDGKELDSGFIKELLSFSTPVALQEGLYALTSWFTVILLLYLGGFGEVGLYAAAIQWSVIILFVPGILRNVILTHLAGTTNDTSVHDRVLKRTLCINFIATIIPLAIIFVLRSWIAGFYGESYRGELENILPISVFTTIFLSLSNVYAQAFMSINKNWQMFGIRVLRDIIILLLTFTLVQYRYYPAAMSFAVSSLMGQAIFYVVLIKVYHKLTNI